MTAYQLCQPNCFWADSPNEPRTLALCGDEKHERQTKLCLPGNADVLLSFELK